MPSLSKPFLLAKSFLLAKPFLLAGAILVLGVAAAVVQSSGFRITPNGQDRQQASRDTVATIARLFPRTKEHSYALPLPGSYRLPVIKRAGDGDVLDTQGKPRRLAEFMKGKITVLSFIYALCSDTQGCPLATATLFDARDASKELPKIARNTRFISLSFDPKRDTPKAMESYGYPVFADPEGGKKISWNFLTTKSARQLLPILKAYGQVINPKADGDTIAHLLRVFLIDRKNRVRNIYGVGFLDPRILFADIETLLMEEAAGGRGENL